MCVCVCELVSCRTITCSLLDLPNLELNVQLGFHTHPSVEAPIAEAIEIFLCRCEEEVSSQHRVDLL